MATTDERHEKGARSQSFFRDVNERIEQINVADGVPASETWEFLCECADRGCVATISLTQDEYEAVRRVPTHFVVKRGHIYREIERVVEENSDYLIVEKFGEGAKVTVKLDPRREIGNPSSR